MSNLTLRNNNAARLEAWEDPRCVHSKPQHAAESAPWSPRRKLAVILGLNAFLWAVVLASLRLL